MREIAQTLDAFLDGGILPDGKLPEYSDDFKGSPTTGLLRQVAVHTGELGFGLELSCWDDFTENFALIDPNSTLAVLQSNYRRLNTPLGYLTLIGEPGEYGKDIRGLLQKGMTPLLLRYHEQDIKDQILDDNRNQTCEVAITEQSGGLVIDIKGTTSYGPYTLTMALTNGEVLIQAMNAEAQNAAQ